MAGIKAEQVIQLGAELTPGTAVAATTIWRGAGGQIKDAREVTFVPELVGYTLPTNRTYIGKLEATLAMGATPATFEQIGYLLQAGVKAVSGAPDGSGYIYTYLVGTTQANAIQPYTIETGDNQQAHEMEYSIVKDFTLTGNAGEAVMMSANWVGRQKTAASLTSLIGSGPQAVETILAGKGTLYIDDNTGTLGSTAVTDTLLSWTLNFNTGRNVKYTVDSGALYFDFDYFDIDSFDVTLDVVFEHNSTAVTEYGTKFTGEAGRLIRLKITGSALQTAGSSYTTKALVLDLTGKWESWEELGSQDGNSIVSGTFRVGYDETDDTGCTIVVVNELSALV